MKFNTISPYMLHAVLLMLAACSQEELMPPAGDGLGERIIFRTSVPQVTSRAKEVTAVDIDIIHVTAFNPDNESDGALAAYFNDMKLAKGSSGIFSSDSCRWPERERYTDRLHFLAYYPALNEGAVIVNASTVSGKVPEFKYSVNGFRVANNISEQVDFITAYTTGSMEENMFSCINLEFEHQLSRVEVKAKGSNKSCKLEIAGVRIGKLGMNASHKFKTGEDAGGWTMDESKAKENVEYIYCPGDTVVEIDDTKAGVTIMGGHDKVKKQYAMLIPASYNAWKVESDSTNSSEGTYISVLLRVLDKTPGGNDKQQYPYFDNSQGLNAMNINRVYLAVNSDNIVIACPGKLYKGGNGKYYTNPEMTAEYHAPRSSVVKEFGWAALPVTANWEAGRSYTYTLDFTYGVGLHDPSVTGATAPKAGDPVISDRVGVTVSVNGWQGLNGSTTHTVEVPGS